MAMCREEQTLWDVMVMSPLYQGKNQKDKKFEDK